mmetsp:Transcript_17987/g.31479  ORF Transcript_17987/g.31479 Transcript_17987/m.31479 type:complete len:242 (-) Transcript_17987:51-776(-)|eukprot:CAMPEP_0168584602 /NCGR_PEP_ID=MMETSP0420-20121227/3230_1 /TAXON_ID=498008 /ORGANISM="Pessonella sp." /LENGTH=241 /DNA_ID=CAMNT_0008619421 /DNA_START=22 /DNA_END=747 /DNA_ORIENTATION=+
MVRALITEGTRNPELVRGIRARGKVFRKRKNALWIKKNGLLKKEKKSVAKKEVKKFGKGTRTIKKKERRFYPTEKVTRKVKRNFTPRPTRLRKSIEAGSVLILLSGRFRGKRVVFLKQLESGLLLVNGPFSVNGVPLRRVDQAYVIATSTKVDISGVKLDDKIDDKFFKLAKVAAPKDDENKFFNKKEAKKDRKVSDERRKLQKSVDDQLVAAIKKVSNLKAYIGSRFTLTNGQYPHELKF